MVCKNKVLIPGIKCIENTFLRDYTRVVMRKNISVLNSI